MKFIKPRVIISRCLGFDACRYNGQSLPQDAVEALKPHVEFTHYCPEAEIGLGIPRPAVRLAQDQGETQVFQPATGKTYTREMTDRCRSITKEWHSPPDINAPDGFILKSKSPTCGPRNVKEYPSLNPNSGSPRRTSGFLAAQLLDRFPELPWEDEGRLRNFTYREHFLTALFCRARFRGLASLSMGALVDFHSRYKLLFMAYNQAGLKRLGNLTANHEKKAFGQVLSHYSRELGSLFSRPAKPGSMINALQHGFSRMSSRLSSQERQFFVNTLEEYRDERIPLSVPLHLLKGWALRLENSYLLGQALLKPYPEELVAITDSGQGRIYR